MSEIQATFKVSIGMPVYNGEKFIRDALDSLLRQSFPDFELIISDNASTDGTERICREYAAQDQRIRYVRQPANLGANANFKFVLDEAHGEYFMWAACDDTRSLDFLELNFKFLSENPEYVASTSPNRFENQSSDKRNLVDFALDGQMSERFVQFFDHCWVSHGIFYSLFRTSVVRDCDVLSQSAFLGSDWAMILYFASKGKINRTKGGYIILGINGFSRDPKFFKVMRNDRIELLLPFYRLMRYVINLTADFPLDRRLQIILISLRPNLSVVFYPLRRTFRSIRCAMLGTGQT